MKVLLIQLSDMHIKMGENSVLRKGDQLFSAIRNSTAEYDEIFLIVTGDIAFSGKKEEYSVGFEFLNSLKEKLESYSSKQIHTITVPGNHDCDFSLDSKARQNQLAYIRNLGDIAVDESVVEQCVSVQSAYFDFKNTVEEKDKSSYCKPLLSVYSYGYGDKHIVFHCYNTAYMSMLHEEYGGLFYPTTQLPEQVFTVKADLTVALLHHSPNWLTTTNRREFETHISKTADIYLTGHEHVMSMQKIDDLEENLIYHVEGSVLQEENSLHNSEFNLIGFDLGAGEYKIESFSWKTDKYVTANENTKWRSFIRSKNKLKSKYTLTKSFEDILGDVGGKFRHPYKSDIRLSDIYVYPTLRYFNTKDGGDEDVSTLLENAESVIGNIKPNSRYLIFGGENTGKTSLLRMIFTTLYRKNYVPVIIDGRNIKNSHLEDFQRLVKAAFISQYGDSSIVEFLQEDIANVYILIDDFDKNPLKNQKAKGRLIKAICQYYKNLMFIGSELYAIEEMITDEETPGDLFSEFHQYEILEFNYSMRAKLIHRWYTLGREEFVADDEAYSKIDAAMLAIDVAMGQRIVPNCPIFILILLQALETTNPHNLKVSSYGNYYQLLILKAFTDNIADHSDLSTYQSYCAELANLFFEHRTTAISRLEFDEFHKDIRRFERMDLPDAMTSDATLIKLCEIGVLVLDGDNVQFKYQYTYYYFQAQYLAKYIAKEEIKNVIAKLCQRLYRTEFANVLMFLIHFSSDDFIIQQLLDNASGVFAELDPCRLEDDILHLHELVSQLPKLVLKSKSIDDVRDEEYSNHDAAELKTRESEIAPTWDIDEDISEIDIVSKLNLSFKLIEIIGQILKNNPSGSMPGPLKYKLLKETYLLGLRSLNVLFTVLNDNTDFIVNQLQDAISEWQKKRDEMGRDGVAREIHSRKIEQIARRILFSLCTQISYTFIKKISDSVGTSKLMEKYLMVKEDHDYASVKLLNFLIRLDHMQSGFPHQEMADIKKYVEQHSMSSYLLSRIVLNHLHRHPVTYKDRQRICKFLGISIENQLILDASRKKQQDL